MTHGTRRQGTGPGLALFLLLMVLASASVAERSLVEAPPAPEGARGEAIVKDGEPRIEARLLLHPEDPARAGVWIGMAPGWHVYWRNPGETGVATEVEWSGAGLETADPLAWPVPKAFPSGDGGASYGYGDEVLLTSTLRWSPEAASDALLRAQVDLLACEHECIPARIVLERRRQPADADEGLGRLFSRWAERVPAKQADTPIQVFYAQSAVRPGDRFEAALALPDAAPAEGAVFYPYASEPVVWQSGATRDGHLELAGEAEAEEDAIEPMPTRLTGVLAWPGHARELDLPFPSAPTGSAVTMLGPHWRGPASGGLAGVTLLEVLALAFLGGLILNLMPCVLPVLAIKVFALAEMAEHGRGERLRHASAYALGILSSMLALAVVVVALRSAGRAVGWGFQLQEPIFAAGVAAVVVAFALNLFGVYEIRLGTERLAAVGNEATGANRSFFEGLLAVTLATPCSAPFLGTAVGFAFASPAPVIIGVFLAVGAGLAAPFVLAACIPGSARLVPKSGRWMLTLRAGLGFTLLGTAVWLLHVFSVSAGPGGLASLTALLVILSFGLWILGQLQEAFRPRLSLLAATGVLLVAVTGLNTVRAQLPERPPAGTERTVTQVTNP